MSEWCCDDDCEIDELHPPHAIAPEVRARAQAADRCLGVKTIRRRMTMAQLATSVECYRCRGTGLGRGLHHFGRRRCKPCQGAGRLPESFVPRTPR